MAWLSPGKSGDGGEGAVGPEMEQEPGLVGGRGRASPCPAALRHPEGSAQAPRVPFPGCDLPVFPLRAPQAFLERLAHPDCP